jgi:peptidyl-prolyl cis-trans isomerase D
MATLEKLRNRAGTLVAVVIGLALLAFILGDFVGSGGSLFTRNQFEIAEISGKSIPYQTYQERIDHITELNKASRRVSALDEQTSENIREEVWNQLVQENVLGSKYNNLGIAISPEELVDMVQGRNLHPIIRQEFGNPQTGEVDVAMVDQFIRNLDNDPSGFQRSIWLYLEDIILRDRQFTKYNNLISKGLFVTDLQAKKSVSERSNRVDVNYLVDRYTSISDSLVSVSSSEISSYYKKNIKKYQQDASRDVEYVVFPIIPSADDYKLAEEWITKIKPDFINAADPVQFTNLNSDKPFQDKYYKQGELPIQELNQWAFNANFGDTYGPIFDANTYSLAKLVKIDFRSDSVKARHILIDTRAQAQVDPAVAKVKADSIFQVAKRGGNFAQLATKYSADPGSASKGGDLGWFNEGMMVKPFNDACFNGKKGDIVLVETQFGFHIIEILDKGKTTKKVQVALLDRNVTPSTRTYQHIYQQASEFAGLNNSSEKFDLAVQEKKLSKRLASNLKEFDKRVAGLENPREMVRWAFREEESAVSPVFEFGDNFVVATLRAIREKGDAPLASVEQEIRTVLIQDKKAELIEDKFKKVLAEGKTLEDVSAQLSLPIQNANRISFSSFSIPALGFEPAIIASAVNSPEGKLVGPIKGNSGVFMLSVNAVNVDEIEPKAEASRMLGLYQSRAMREVYEAVKEASNIVDKRATFF